ncbi:MAG: hypothetical protein GY754_13115 [bacterium]|nr:hypothetical protein [bacterium]
MSYEKPVTTKSEESKILELLNFISESEPNETPGKLEKRIAKHKILPKTDKYKRYGILLTLSECGILPNEFIPPKYDKFSTKKEIRKASENLTTSHRSDIILPPGVLEAIKNKLLIFLKYTPYRVSSSAEK